MKERREDTQCHPIKKKFILPDLPTLGPPSTAIFTQPTVAFILTAGFSGNGTFQDFTDLTVTVALCQVSLRAPSKHR